MLPLYSLNSRRGSRATWNSSHTINCSYSTQQLISPLSNGRDIRLFVVNQLPMLRIWGVRCRLCESICLVNECDPLIKDSSMDRAHLIISFCYGILAHSLHCGRLCYLEGCLLGQTRYICVAITLSSSTAFPPQQHISPLLRRIRSWHLSISYRHYGTLQWGETCWV